MEQFCGRGQSELVRPARTARMLEAAAPEPPAPAPHVQDEKDITHPLSRVRAAHTEFLVEDGRALSANAKPAGHFFFSTYAPDVPLDRATIRGDVKILGDFYSRIVIARMRFQRVALVTDGGKNGGPALYPVQGFYVDEFGRAHHEYLTLFAYDSAKTANIVADMAKLIEFLEANDVNVVGVVIDNAKNLRGAFEMESNFGTVQVITGKPLLHSPCCIHTGVLVIGDAKQIPLFDQALTWLRPFMQFIRAPARRLILKGAGIQGKFPLVQDGKWNTEVQSFLFYRTNAAVIERVIREQKWKPPAFRDEFNVVIDALLPMRTLIERTERGDTTLADFFVMQLA